jgi:hypothetical protein
MRLDVHIGSRLSPADGRRANGSRKCSADVVGTSRRRRLGTGAPSVVLVSFWAEEREFDLLARLLAVYLEPLGIVHAFDACKNKNLRER